MEKDDTGARPGAARKEVAREAEERMEDWYREGATTEVEEGDFLRALAYQGGIVEERIEGEDLRSPSAQLRISPSGQVEILSTHDQVLGGPHGQTYFGCRFPADP